MTRVAWSSMIVGLLGLGAGCTDDGGGGGGGGGGGDSACALEGSTSGAIAWSGSGDPACVIPFGGAAGILMIFIPDGDEVSRIELDVDDVREGEVGVYPTIVRVSHDAQTVWTTAGSSCTVSITEHAFTGHDDGFSREFQVVGSGTCTAPATRAGTAETVTIDPFAFRFPARW